MSGTNRPLSIVAAVASIAGLILLGWFLLEPDGPSWRFLASIVAGAVGAVLGFVDGRSGRNTANRIGLYLGVAVVVADILIVTWLTPVSMTTTAVEPVG